MSKHRQKSSPVNHKRMVLGAVGKSALLSAALLVAGSLRASPILLVATSAAAPQPQPQAPAAQPPTIPLKVVNKSLFCSRLQQAFASYAEASGFDRVQVTLMASNAASQIVEEFRAGRTSDYINAEALAQLGRAQQKPGAGAYLPLAGFMGPAMGLGQNVSLALSAAELRYIPHAQKGLDLVVIAKNAASLTPERAQKVAEVAASMGIHIHVAWVGDGEGNLAVNEAKSLAWVAAATDGVFVNLSGANPCGSDAM